MRQPKRQHVLRMRRQNLFPDTDRAIEIAADPGLQSGDMRLLARRCVRAEAAGRLRRLDCRGHVGLLVGQQRKIALETMRQAELAVCREQVRQARSRVGAILQIAEQRAVERGRGLRRRGGKRQSVEVMRHLACSAGE
jgi:hypothetical protein